MDWLPKFVQDYLSFTGKCFRHCGKPTSLRLISEESNHVFGAYICPDSFVSQVVYFSQKPDLTWFNNTIATQVGRDNFSTNDVRTATRHGWELGETAGAKLKTELGPNSSFTEIYWTRYARTDDEKRIAISLCTGDHSRPGCLRLFSHESGTTERFCPACRRG